MSHSSRDGVRGGGMLSRWPVESASTVLRYSLTASMNQPTRVRIRVMTPTASSQPPKTRPSSSIAVPSAAEERAERRTGHVHAGRRAGVDLRRQRRDGVADVLVVGPQRLGQPVQQGQRQGDRAEDEGQPAEHEAQEQQARRRAPRRPGRTTARACGCRPGVCGSSRCLPRRGLGARRSRRNVQTRMIDDEDEDEDRQQGDDRAPIRDDELRRQLKDAGPQVFEHRWSSGPSQSFGEPATRT